MNELATLAPTFDGRIELDVEENWFQQAVLGFPSRAVAVESIHEGFAKMRRTFDITIIPYSPELTYRHFAPQASRVAMQAYSQYEGGRPGYGWSERLGPGSMQQLAWSRYAAIEHKGSELVVGLAAYDQQFPEATLTEAMRVAHDSALKLQPAEIRWWSAKHVIRGVNAHQRAASRFIEGVEFAPASFPDVHLGEWGPWIRAAQRLLNTAGFDAGVEDGKFGTRTLKALHDWQSSRGLTRATSITAHTWAHLNVDDTTSVPASPQSPTYPSPLSARQESAAIEYNDSRAPDLRRNVARLLGEPPLINRAYTPQLVRAIARYQQEYQLVADGMIGPNTRAYVEDDMYVRDFRSWWPGTDKVPSEWYRERLRAAVGDVIDTEVLIALRGLKFRAKRTHRVRSLPRYDDTFLLFRAHGGEADVLEFRGATHPYQRTSRLSPDQNLDGQPDVSMIRPGRYMLRRRRGAFKGRPALVVTDVKGDGRIPSYNDTNHDGYFSSREIAQAIAGRRGEQADDNGYFATGILIHPGFDTRHGSGSKRFSSIGCVTMSLKHVELVYDWVGTGTRPLVVVDATDLVDSTI